jgi:hypothetical protein
VGVGGVDMQETRIEKINKEIETTKKTIKEKEVIVKNKVEFKESDNSMDCKICGINFKRNIDLENHILLSHEEYPGLQCDECDNIFLLMWRLKKHTRLHTEKHVLN